MKKALFFASLLAAALSFVGCNKEAEFFGRNGRKMQIVLSDVNTRTVNDGLATKWVDGDALNVFYAPAGTTDYSANAQFTVDDAAANHATGTAELTAEAYDWYLLYPYDSHVKTPASTNAGYMTIGSAASKQQAQKGLDNMAHLAGEHMPVYGVAKNVAATATPEVAMKQVASVVAVNLTNATDQPLAVDAVSFTAPEDIVGTFYIDFTGEALAFVGSGANYVSKTATLNVTEADAIAAGASAKFYIAVKPFAAKAGDKLAVKINSGEQVFEKEITLPSAVEFKSGVIKTLNISYTGGTVVEASTLEEIAAMDKDTDVVTGEVLVVAKNAKGVMLCQDGFYLQAYANANMDAAIGDIVTVSGKVGEYSGLKQIVNPEVEIVSSGNEVKLPDPKVLEGLDEYESSKIELIQYAGTLAVSGNYYNVKVEGSTRQGSIQYPIDTEALKALDKKLVTATGFFTGISGSSTKYVNIMSTSVEEKEGNVFDVAPQQINVAASATSAEINVTGNVEWTADASDGATVTPASGTGEGTITVSFPANEDTENTKEYTVFVRTEATGVNDEFEVNITQGKAVSGNYFVKVTSTADLVDGLYLIVNEKAGVALKDAVDETSNGLAVTISGGAVEATAEVKAVAFTFTASNGAFQGPNGKYLAHSGTKNTLNPTDTPSANTVTFENGNAIITAEDAYFIQYNKSSGQERFRYYKNAQTDGEVQLYKLSDGYVPPQTVTLQSISISGQQTEFNVGDTFTLGSNAKVMAKYSDGSEKDVTAKAEHSNPDMATAGTKEVTVTYTENEASKSAKYNITVKGASALSSVADVLTGGPGTYSLEGLLVYAVAGSNAIVGDATGKMLLYKSGHGLKVGDIVDAEGVTVTDYNGVLELTSGTYTKKSSGNPVNHGTAVSLDDASAASGVYNTFSASGYHSAQFISITGNQSGRYIQNDNAKLYMNVADATNDGHKVVSTGYVYSYSTNYQNYNYQVVTIEKSSDDCSVSVDASALTWEANDTGSKTVTVTTTNPATGGFSVSPASLEHFEYTVSGNVITISPKGTVTATATETLTLKHTTDANVTATVTLTRKAAGSTEVTDILNQAFTGITGTSYTEFSGKVGESGAVYAGQCAGSNSSIQLRSNNNNSGVITTATGGKVRKVTVTWNSNTSAGRTLNIYGKNEAYSAATDLYDTAKQGTLLGTIVCGSSVDLIVPGDYQFIGFRSDNGAMYLTEVQIVWE